jgi:hypothetical protein
MIHMIHSYKNFEDSTQTNRQPVCVKCSHQLGQVIRLCVKRNGVVIPYGHDSAQVGDLLVCPICHTEIIQSFSEILSKSVCDQVLTSEYAILKGVKDYLVLM